MELVEVCLGILDRKNARESTCACVLQLLQRVLNRDHTCYHTANSIPIPSVLQARSDNSPSIAGVKPPATPPPFPASTGPRLSSLLSGSDGKSVTSPSATSPSKTRRWIGERHRLLGPVVDTFGNNRGFPILIRLISRLTPGQDNLQTSRIASEGGELANGEKHEGASQNQEEPDAKTATNGKEEADPIPSPSSSSSTSERETPKWVVVLEIIRVYGNVFPSLLRTAARKCFEKLRLKVCTFFLTLPLNDIKTVDFTLYHTVEQRLLAMAEALGVEETYSLGLRRFLLNASIMFLDCPFLEKRLAGLAEIRRMVEAGQRGIRTRSNAGGSGHVGVYDGGIDLTTTTGSDKEHESSRILLNLNTSCSGSSSNNNATSSQGSNQIQKYFNRESAKVGGTGVDRNPTSSPEAVAEVLLWCQELSSWLSEARFIERLFGGNMHYELVRRSSEVVSFVAQFSGLSSMQLDLIWDASLRKHDSIVRSLHSILVDIALVLDLESAVYMVGRLTSLPFSTLDMDQLRLIHSFSLNAIQAHETHVSGGLPKAVEDDHTENSQNSGEAAPESVKPNQSNVFGIPYLWDLVNFDGEVSAAIRSVALDMLVRFFQWPQSNAVREAYIEKAIQNLTRAWNVSDSLRLLSSMLSAYPDPHMPTSAKPSAAESTSAGAPTTPRPDLIQRLNKEYGLLDLVLDNIVKTYSSQSSTSAASRVNVMSMQVEQEEVGAEGVITPHVCLELSHVPLCSPSSSNDTDLPQSSSPALSTGTKIAANAAARDGTSLAVSSTRMSPRSDAKQRRMDPSVRLPLQERIHQRLMFLLFICENSSLKLELDHIQLLWNLFVLGQMRLPCVVAFKEVDGSRSSTLASNSGARNNGLSRSESQSSLPSSMSGLGGGGSDAVALSSAHSSTHNSTVNTCDVVEMTHEVKEEAIRFHHKCTLNWLCSLISKGEGVVAPSTLEYLFESLIPSLDMKTLSISCFDLFEALFRSLNIANGSIAEAHKPFASVNNSGSNFNNKNSNSNSNLKRNAAKQRHEKNGSDCIKHSPSSISTSNAIVVSTDLAGLATLWEIAFSVQEKEVGARAMGLLTDLHTRLHESLEADTNDLYVSSVDRVMTRMKECTNEEASSPPRDSSTIRRCVEILSTFLATFKGKQPVPHSLFLKPVPSSSNDESKGSSSQRIDVDTKESSAANNRVTAAAGDESTDKKPSGLRTRTISEQSWFTQNKTFGIVITLVHAGNAGVRVPIHGITPSLSVGELKESISELYQTRLSVSVEASRLRLMHSGRELTEDTKLLYDYRIGNQNVLVAAIRLRGVCGDSSSSGSGSSSHDLKGKSHVVQPIVHPAVLLSEKDRFQLLFRALRVCEPSTSQLVWDLVMKLPSNADLLSSLIDPKLPWKELLSFDSIHELHYAMQVIDAICSADPESLIESDVSKDTASSSSEHMMSVDKSAKGERVSNDAMKHPEDDVNSGVKGNASQSMTANEWCSSFIRTNGILHLVQIVGETDFVSELSDASITGLSSPSTQIQCLSRLLNAIHRLLQHPVSRNNNEVRASVSSPLFVDAIFEAVKLTTSTCSELPYLASLASSSPAVSVSSGDAGEDEGRNGRRQLSASGDDSSSNSGGEIRVIGTHFFPGDSTMHVVAENLTSLGGGDSFIPSDSDEAAAGDDPEEDFDLSEPDDEGAEGHIDQLEEITSEEEDGAEEGGMGVSFDGVSDAPEDGGEVDMITFDASNTIEYPGSSTSKSAEELLQTAEPSSTTSHHMEVEENDPVEIDMDQDGIQNDSDSESFVGPLKPTESASENPVRKPLTVPIPITPVSTPATVDRVDSAGAGENFPLPSLGADSTKKRSWASLEAVHLVAAVSCSLLQTALSFRGEQVVVEWLRGIDAGRPPSFVHGKGYKRSEEAAPTRLSHWLTLCVCAPSEFARREVVDSLRGIVSSFLSKRCVEVLDLAFAGVNSMLSLPNPVNGVDETSPDKVNSASSVDRLSEGGVTVDLTSLCKTSACFFELACSLTTEVITRRPALTSARNKEVDTSSWGERFLPFVSGLIEKLQNYPSFEEGSSSADIDHTICGLLTLLEKTLATLLLLPSSLPSPTSTSVEKLNVTASVPSADGREDDAIGGKKRKRGSSNCVKSLLSQLILQSNIIESVFHILLFDRVHVTSPMDLTSERLVEASSRPLCKTSHSRKRAMALLHQLGLVSAESSMKVLSLYESQCSSVPPDRPWYYDPLSDVMSDTGFVGLKNLGATCYMNSLVQQLFMVPEFRYALLAQTVEPTTHPHSDGTEEEERKQADDAASFDVEQSVLFQMQRIFGFLQESRSQYVDARRFSRAYVGIDGQPMHFGVQMDVNEFFNVLFDKLESDLKGKPRQKLLDHVFGGTLSNQLICKECPHRSERDESFFILSLEVKNKRSIVDSLRQYVQGEMLEGDNKYMCRTCMKKVDTLKRCCIKELPNNLILHLKRFEFNFDTMCKVKVNDYCEFPTLLDMAPYTKEALEEEDGEEAAGSEEGQGANPPGGGSDASAAAPTPSALTLKGHGTMYRLSGVLVHTGTCNSGHYYSFVKDRTTESNPEDEYGSWYEFNDRYVAPFDAAKELAEQCFGGPVRSSPMPSPTSSSTDSSSEQQIPLEFLSSCKPYNAYMLFYERIPNTGEGEEERRTLPQSTSTAAAVEKSLPVKSESAPLPAPEQSSPLPPTTGTDKRKHFESMSSTAAVCDSKTTGAIVTGSTVKRVKLDCDVDDPTGIVDDDAAILENHLNGAADLRERVANIPLDTLIRRLPRHLRASLVPPSVFEECWTENNQKSTDRDVFSKEHIRTVWSAILSSTAPDDASPETRAELSLTRCRLLVSFCFNLLIHARHRNVIKEWPLLLFGSITERSENIRWFFHFLRSEGSLSRLLIGCPIPSIRKQIAELVKSIVEHTRDQEKQLYESEVLGRAPAENGEDISMKKIRLSHPVPPPSVGDDSSRHDLCFLQALMEPLHSAAENLKQSGEYFDVVQHCVQLGSDELRVLLQKGLLLGLVQVLLGEANPLLSEADEDSDSDGDMVSGNGETKMMDVEDEDAERDSLAVDRNETARNSFWKSLPRVRTSYVRSRYSEKLTPLINLLSYVTCQVNFHSPHIASVVSSSDDFRSPSKSEVTLFVDSLLDVATALIRLETAVPAVVQLCQHICHHDIKTANMLLGYLLDETERKDCDSDILLLVISRVTLGDVEADGVFARVTQVMEFVVTALCGTDASPSMQGTWARWLWEISVVGSGSADAVMGQLFDALCKRAARGSGNDLYATLVQEEASYIDENMQDAAQLAFSFVVLHLALITRTLLTTAVTESSAVYGALIVYRVVSSDLELFHKSTTASVFDQLLSIGILSADTSGASSAMMVESDSGAVLDGDEDKKQISEADEKNMKEEDSGCVVEGSKKRPNFLTRKHICQYAIHCVSSSLVLHQTMQWFAGKRSLRRKRALSQNNCLIASLFNALRSLVLLVPSSKRFVFQTYSNEIMAVHLESDSQQVQCNMNQLSLLYLLQALISDESLGGLTALVDVDVLTSSSSEASKEAPEGKELMPSWRANREDFATTREGSWVQQILGSWTSVCEQEEDIAFNERFVPLVHSIACEALVICPEIAPSFVENHTLLWRIQHVSVMSTTHSAGHRSIMRILSLVFSVAASLSDEGKSRCALSVIDIISECGAAFPNPSGALDLILLATGPSGYAEMYDVFSHGGHVTLINAANSLLSQDLDDHVGVISARLCQILSCLEQLSPRGWSSLSPVMLFLIDCGMKSQRPQSSEPESGVPLPQVPCAVDVDESVWSVILSTCNKYCEYIEHTYGSIAPSPTNNDQSGIGSRTGHGHGRGSGDGGDGSDENADDRESSLHPDDDTLGFMMPSLAIQCVRHVVSRLEPIVFVWLNRESSFQEKLRNPPSSPLLRCNSFVQFASVLQWRIHRLVRHCQACSVGRRPAPWANRIARETVGQSNHLIIASIALAKGSVVSNAASTPVASLALFAKALAKNMEAFPHVPILGGRLDLPLLYLLEPGAFSVAQKSPQLFSSLVTVVLNTSILLEVPSEDMEDFLNSIIPSNFDDIERAAPLLFLVACTLRVQSLLPVDDSDMARTSSSPETSVTAIESIQALSSAALCRIRTMFESIPMLETLLVTLEAEMSEGPEDVVEVIASILEALRQI